MSVIAIYRQSSGIMRGMRCGRAAVVGLGLVVIWCASATLRAQTEADWDWANKAFGTALDTLMPLHAKGGLYVTYRANRDFVTSIPEYWFRIGYEFNEKQGYGLNSFFSAHVRIASPNSIYDQVMALHRSNRATQKATAFLQVSSSGATTLRK